MANSVFTALAETRVLLGVNDSLEGKTLPNSAIHQISKWPFIFMAYESELSRQIFHNYWDVSKDI